MGTEVVAGQSLNSDLWVPLVFDVLIGGGARDGEADDEDVGLRVGQRPQSVILLLTRRVPQVQTDGPAVHRHLNTPRTQLHTHTHTHTTGCGFVDL